MCRMPRKALFVSLSVLVCGSAILAASNVVSGKDPFTPAQRNYWAFQPVVRVQPPAVQNHPGVLNPIDGFVLSKLEAKGLKPSAPADRVTLIRRVTFDLVGLPPTPEEV